MKTDADLKRDVAAEIGWDPAIKSTAIGVAVKDGVVTLTGHLDTSRPLAADLRRVKWGKAGLPASARGRFTAPPSDEADEAEDAGEATSAEPAAGPAAEPPESTRAELVDTPEPG